MVAESKEIDSSGALVDPKVDRGNGLLFFVSYLLIYFAAPVTYVGVVQAALCDKLGASATVASLPLSVYSFGWFAPLFLSWAVPHRYERTAVVLAESVTAALLALVGITLLLPFSDGVRITAVVLHGCVMGLTASASQLFMLQCMRRGTTVEGRARAFKLAFGFGPLSAVAGSLGAQFLLNRGIPALTHPYDFAILYLIGAPCMAGVAVAMSRFRVVPMEDEKRPPLAGYLMETVRGFATTRVMATVWLAYFLFYCTLGGMPNISLFTKVAMGADPKEFSGLIMAFRFGFKALGGFLLGALTLRYGIRAPLLATVSFIGVGTLWAWVVPGFAYLLAFGWMGAGELGGAYFPNYVISSSSMLLSPRNLSLLSLTLPAASFAPTLHGLLTDLVGFKGSFGFGCFCAVLALLLVLRLPRGPRGNQP